VNEITTNGSDTVLELESNNDGHHTARQNYSHQDKLIGPRCCDLINDYNLVVMVLVGGCLGGCVNASKAWVVVPRRTSIHQSAPLLQHPHATDSQVYRTSHDTPAAGSRDGPILVVR
jgi:hypothetical protein